MYHLSAVQKSKILFQMMEYDKQEFLEKIVKDFVDEWV